MIFAKDTIEWITVCVECCAFLEQNDNLNEREFLDRALLLFPLLYLKTRMIPAIDEEQIDDNAYLTPHVTETEYEQLKATLSEKMGEQDEYLETFHPDMPLSDAPIIASISEDLADIYQSIKDLVANYAIDNDQVRLLAIKEGRDAFYDYWGQKALNALRAMHDVRQSLNDEIDEQ